MIMAHCRNKPNSYFVYFCGLIMITCVGQFVQNLILPNLSRRHKRVHEPVDDVECANKLRIRRLTEKCLLNNWKEDTFGLYNATAFRNLLVSDYHETIYCVIPKVGCTTFKHLMTIKRMKHKQMTIHGHVHRPGYMSRHSVTNLASFSPTQAKYRLDNYFKFIVVRHPFSRLLSAYSNKIYTTGPLVQKHAETIDEYFGAGTAADDQLSVSQFLELLTERPDEFSDPHWVDYFSQCLPCDVEYDQILKLESIDRDYIPIVNHLYGQTSDNVEGLPSFNSRKADDRPSDVNVEFANQNESVIVRLRELYRRDFELFGYEWNMTNGTIIHDKYGCGTNSTDA